MKLKSIIISLFLFTLALNSQNMLYDSIMLDEIKRIYPENTIEELPYTISFNFELNRYRVGEPILMEVRIYAKKGTVGFTNSPNPFENYKFTVYDENNKVVMESDNYALWAYRDRSLVSDNKYRTVTLMEGETYSYTVDLNNWFNFEKKGNYKIAGGFNPMPDISRHFYMAASPSYFFVDNAIVGQKPILPTQNVIKENYTSPSSEPPYTIVSNTLGFLKNKQWDNYFQNMYIPSLINISERFSQRFKQNYTGAYIEDFTEIGLNNTASKISFEKFLAEQYIDQITVSTMRSNFGNNFVENIENAFKANTVNDLAVRFELLYRTALPEERRRLFNEFKLYIASSYDREVRVVFMAEAERKAINSKDEKEKQYYRELLDMMKKEYNPAVTFTLLNYEILKTTIEEKYGLMTATVSTMLYERFFNFDTGDIYEPKINRIFTLRKMGEYWYIVDYYDMIGRN